MGKSCKQGRLPLQCLRHAGLHNLALFCLAPVACRQRVLDCLGDNLVALEEILEIVVGVHVLYPFGALSPELLPPVDESVQLSPRG